MAGTRPPTPMGTPILGETDIIAKLPPEVRKLAEEFGQAMVASMLQAFVAGYRLGKSENGNITVMKESPRPEVR